MIAYTLYRLIYMFNRMNPDITRTTYIKSADQDLEFRPQETGFDFAFTVSSPMDPSIGFFTVQEVKLHVVNNTRQKNHTAIDIGLCNNSFNYYD